MASLHESACSRCAALMEPFHGVSGHYFDWLDDQVLCQILSCLDLRTICRLAGTSRRFYVCVESFIRNDTHCLSLDLRSMPSRGNDFGLVSTFEFLDCVHCIRSRFAGSDCPAFSHISAMEVRCDSRRRSALDRRSGRARDIFPVPIQLQKVWEHLEETVPPEMLSSLIVDCGKISVGSIVQCSRLTHLELLSCAGLTDSSCLDLFQIMFGTGIRLRKLVLASGSALSSVSLHALFRYASRLVRSSRDPPAATEETEMGTVTDTGLGQGYSDCLQDLDIDFAGFCGADVSLFPSNLQVDLVANFLYLIAAAGEEGQLDETWRALARRCVALAGPLMAWTRAIRRLTFRRFAVRKKDLELICIASYSVLQELSVFDSAISDESVCRILLTLQKSSLRSLRLCGCPALTGSFLTRLLDEPSCLLNESLHLMDLEGCNNVELSQIVAFMHSSFCSSEGRRVLLPSLRMTLPGTRRDPRPLADWPQHLLPLVLSTGCLGFDDVDIERLCDLSAGNDTVACRRDPRESVRSMDMSASPFLRSPSVDRLMQQLQGMNLTTVDVSRCIFLDGSSIFRTAVSLSAHLQRLTLRYLPSLQLSDLGDLASASLSCRTVFPALAEVDLSYCRLVDDDFVAAFLKAFELPALRILLLEGCSGVTSRSAAALAMYAPTLELLNLNYCGAFSNDALRMVVASCQRLTALGLARCHCDAFLPDAATTLSLLSKPSCPCLQYLDMSNWTGGSCGTGSLASAARGESLCNWISFLWKCWRMKSRAGCSDSDRDCNSCSPLRQATVRSFSVKNKVRLVGSFDDVPRTALLAVSRSFSSNLSLSPSPESSSSSSSLLLA